MVNLSGACRELRFQTVNPGLHLADQGPRHWAVGFFFGNLELSMELWTVIAGFDDLGGDLRRVSLIAPNYRRNYSRMTDSVVQKIAPSTRPAAPNTTRKAKANLKQVPNLRSA